MMSRSLFLLEIQKSKDDEEYEEDEEYTDREVQAALQRRGEERSRKDDGALSRRQRPVELRPKAHVTDHMQHSKACTQMSKLENPQYLGFI